MAHRERTELSGRQRVVDGRFCHSDCPFFAANYEEPTCLYDDNHPVLELVFDISGAHNVRGARCLEDAA